MYDSLGKDRRPYWRASEQRDPAAEGAVSDHQDPDSPAPARGENRQDNSYNQFSDTAVGHPNCGDMKIWPCVREDREVSRHQDDRAAQKAADHSFAPTLQRSGCCCHYA
jgi:hypothetical protein